MRRTTARWDVLAIALVALLVGVGAGLALAPSHTDKRNTTVASTSIRTVTRTVARAPSVTAPAQGRTAPRPGPQVLAAPGPTGAKRVARHSFAGTGPRKLGTIEVARSASLRWTSSAGRFQLLVYGGGAVVVDSTARVGQLFAPAGTYRDVEVRAPGRWTIRIG